MAKRAPDTAPENRRIFTSSSICDLTSPTETHRSCGDGQDKSISGPFDNTTFAGAAGSADRARVLRGTRSGLTASLHGIEDRNEARTFG